MSYDVFISYSHENKSTADAVCAKLEQDGVRCWYAPRDVRPGEHWAEAIVRAIESVKVMVVIFTDEANVSKQVFNEISNAVSAGVIIVPFRLTAAPPSPKLKYYFTAVHWLDAIDVPPEKSIADLSAQVRGILGNTPQENAASGQSAPAKPTNRRKIQLLPILLIVLLLAGAGFLLSRTLLKKDPPALTAGSVNGVAYENAYLGLGYIMPNGWQFADSAELTGMNGTEIPAETEELETLIREVQDLCIMSADSPDGTQNVSLYTSYITDPEVKADASGMQAEVNARVEEIRAFYAEAEVNGGADPVRHRIGASEFYGYDLNRVTQEGAYCQRSLLLPKGDILFTLISAATADDEPAAVFQKAYDNLDNAYLMNK